MSEIRPLHLDKQQYKITELLAVAQAFSKEDTLVDADQLIAIYSEALRRFLREKEGLVGLQIVFDPQVHLNGQGRFVVKMLKKKDRYFRVKQRESSFSVFEVFPSEVR